MINDQELMVSVNAEEKRKHDGVTLIASENFAYPEVLELVGSVLTNKYAEGYPGKRYYAGCQDIDEIEVLAIERCKKLFKGEHANVQPYSGSLANMAVYMALLKPGDTIMGMSLSSGGHLTHGHKVSFSGVLYNVIAYEVDAYTEQINYEQLYDLAQKNKPKLIIAGSSSYSRKIDFEKFHAIARSVGAYLLADCAHTAGAIAAGLYPNPFPWADIVTATSHKTLRGPRGGFILCKTEYAKQIDRAVFPLLQGGPAMNTIAAKAYTFKRAQEPEFAQYQKQAVANAQAMAAVFMVAGFHVITNGTDTPLFVVALKKGMTGREAEKKLEQEHIYVSRSLIPGDTQKPWYTSGIRLGTLAITAQGYVEQENSNLAQDIIKILY